MTLIPKNFPLKVLKSSKHSKLKPGDLLWIKDNMTVKARKTTCPYDDIPLTPKTESL